jgi:hypothetical protein
MLARGRGLDGESLSDFHFAANRRVRLDDEAWRDRLLTAATQIGPRVIFLDPLARLKGGVDEDRQREIAPVLDFMRLLRDESGAAVVFVHHVGHGGNHLRGSSDLEGYWESKLTLTDHDSGGYALTAEHREAESAPPLRFAFGFDPMSDTVRLTPITAPQSAGRDLKAEVLANLGRHGDQWRTATEIANGKGGGVGARRKHVEVILTELHAAGAVERRCGAGGRAQDSITYRPVVHPTGTSRDNPVPGHTGRLSPGAPPPLRGEEPGQADQAPVPNARTSDPDQDELPEHEQEVYGLFVRLLDAREVDPREIPR